MNARRLLPALILTVAFVLYGWGCLDLWPRVVDDAYITFRYAQNLAEGLGPVYNPGEPVEGYSSPVWMTLSAGAIAIGIDPVPASKWIGSFATLLLLILTFRFTRRLELPDWGAALIVLLLGSSIVLQIWAVAGMETNLYALLFLAGLLELTRRTTTNRKVLTVSSLLVAAALTRPEGLLFWFCGLLVVLVTARRVQPTPAKVHVRRAALYLVPGLALVAHLAWRLVYYGAALPNTYFAKTGGGPRMWRQGLHGLSIFLAEPAQWIWVAAATAGAAVGLAHPHRRQRVTIVTGVVLLHLLYIVSVGDDGLRIHRFYVPILAPLALLVAELFARDRSSRLRHPRLAVAGVVAVLATTGASLRWLHAEFLPRTLPDLVAYHEGNVKLGRHLARSEPPGTLIAVAAAGAIPYHSKLPAIDMYGLNDARIAREPFPQTTRGRLMKWDNAFVISRKPRIIAINRGYFEPGDPRAQSAARNPTVLARSSMDRDLFQRVARDGSYRLHPILLEDGSVFFVFRRVDDGD